MKKHFRFALGDDEIATLLAALRWYQHSGVAAAAYQPDWLRDINTNGARFLALSDSRIDELCEKLNLDG